MVGRDEGCCAMTTTTMGRVEKAGAEGDILLLCVLEGSASSARPGSTAASLGTAGGCCSPRSALWASCCP